MRANKVGALVILAVLLALVCLASPLAGANPPAEQGVRVAASVAPLLQYQGRLLDAPTGDPLADGDHTMVFRIYNVETEGAALWTESKDVPVANGLFSTVLGDTNALDQALFNGQALWLGVKVGADAEAAPRQPLLPVAYALGLVPGAVIDVDNADVADGALSPAKIAGTAWTSANDSTTMQVLGIPRVFENVLTFGAAQLYLEEKRHYAMATTEEKHGAKALLAAETWNRRMQGRRRYPPKTYSERGDDEVIFRVGTDTVTAA